MRKYAALFFLLSLSLLASQALADVAAIHADKLPQETAVLAALDDVKQLEPYSHFWTSNWQFPIAKDDVTARLEKDLGILNLALKNHPDNIELLLLTGLAARYAYNLDVAGSHEIAISALDHAQKLAASDMRAPWFRGTLLCQTDAQSKAGAEEFLSIEESHAWDQLPASFWSDYVECAGVSNLPAHLLRAVDHLEKLHAPSSRITTVLTDSTRKRYDAFDPNKEYDPKEVWAGINTGDNTEFTSTTCGVRFRAHSNWEIQQLAVNKGACLAIFSTGPYQGTVHNLRPSVVLLVRRPMENETLQEFSRKFMKGSDWGSFAPAHCPAEACMTIQGVQQEMYSEDGGGHARLVFFERNQPDFPGLIFEAPQGLPKSNGSQGARYFHAHQIQQRIPGKLYYLVMLDTAASIDEPAMKDFNFFLQNLIVE